MKEYKIKITGEYDVLVFSPKMIAGLIDKIRVRIRERSSSLRKKSFRKAMRNI